MQSWSGVWGDRDSVSHGVAQTLHQLTRFQEAIEDAEQMIKMAPHSEKGYILKANAYICLARPEDLSEL